MKDLDKIRFYKSIMSSHAMVSGFVKGKYLLLITC